MIDTLIASNDSKASLPIPFGWYHVAFSDELSNGDIKPLRFFSNDLVLYRGETGQPGLLDAYCPHMGAHLGFAARQSEQQGSRVSGDSIVCPFHAWQFNQQGFCTGIPYAKQLPPKVRDQQCLPNYQLREVNKTIWAWYHPEGEPPLFDVPVITELAEDNHDWGALDIYRWSINVHIQEMAENGADPAHFVYVHGTKSFPETQISFDGFTRHGLLETKMKTPKGEVVGRIENRAVGPGVLTTRFSGICETLLLGSVTPIDEQNTAVNYAFVQKKINGQESTGGVGAAIVKDICKQLNEDIPIWENKVYRPSPVLCDGDGPIARYRKWYSQFYVHSAEDKV